MRPLGFLIPSRFPLRGKSNFPGKSKIYNCSIPVASAPLATRLRFARGYGLEYGRYFRDSSPGDDQCGRLKISS